MPTLYDASCDVLQLFQKEILLKRHQENGNQYRKFIEIAIKPCKLENMI